MEYKKVNVAIVGCGAISTIYLKNLTSMFSIINVVACCDLNTELAEKTAGEYNIKSMSLDEIIMDAKIDVVVNLTAPQAHYGVIKNCLLAGKHVYTEKVLAHNLDAACELVKIADGKNLLLCAAPDTFLGQATQTARFAVESGLIGQVTSCVAVLQRDSYNLAERFPFTTKPGGGIGVDVAIYYSTALVSILGPVQYVCGISKTHDKQRTHTFISKGQFGKPYEMQSETMLAGSAMFNCGAVATMHFNSASIRNEDPTLTIYGTDGILMMADPNNFGGEVKILAKGQSTPYVLPPTHGYDGNCRGLGVAEMAWALRKNTTPKAHKEMALHAYEILYGMMKSNEKRTFYDMTTTFDLQSALPRGYLGANYGESEPEAVFCKN